MNESKELLKDCFFYQYFYNKITEKQYLNLRECIDKINENDASRILKEGDSKFIRKTVHSAWIPMDFAVSSLITMLGFAVGSGIGLLVRFAGYRVIRAFFDQCTKHCGVFNINTIRRQICMTKCKLDVLKTVLNKRESIRNKCSTLSKKPEECKKIMDKKIQKIKRQIIIQDAKWKEIQNYSKEKNISVNSNTTDINDPSLNFKLYKKYIK